MYYSRSVTRLVIVDDPMADVGQECAVFEPTHGSAPKYAGQYKVNPIAMLLTTKLMLDWLKEADMATRLESAIARVIAEGKVRTYDMSGYRSDADSPWRGWKKFYA
jgi:isocitrate dehydrogenase (NAD+)